MNSSLVFSWRINHNLVPVDRYIYIYIYAYMMQFLFPGRKLLDKISFWPSRFNRFSNLGFRNVGNDNIIWWQAVNLWQLSKCQLIRLVNILIKLISLVNILTKLSDDESTYFPLAMNKGISLLIKCNVM